MMEMMVGDGSEDLQNDDSNQCSLSWSVNLSSPSQSLRTTWSKRSSTSTGKSPSSAALRNVYSQECINNFSCSSVKSNTSFDKVGNKYESATFSIGRKQSGTALEDGHNRHNGFPKSQESDLTGSFLLSNLSSGSPTLASTVEFSVANSQTQYNNDNDEPLASQSATSIASTISKGKQQQQPKPTLMLRTKSQRMRAKAQKTDESVATESDSVKSAGKQMTSNLKRTTSCSSRETRSSQRSLSTSSQLRPKADKTDRLRSNVTFDVKEVLTVPVANEIQRFDHVHQCPTRSQPVPSQKQFGSAAASTITASVARGRKGHTVKMVATNLDALQESGNFQMLCDEALYLCSVILESKKLLLACKAAAELAVLLSEKSNRKLFFSSGKIMTLEMEANESHIAEDAENTGSLFQRFLDVVAFAKNFTNSNMKMNKSAQTCHSSKHNYFDDCDENELDADDDSTSQCSVSSSVYVNGDSKRNSCLRQHLLNALAMILHYLSLDCTLSPDAALTRRMACTIRLAFLKNHAAMQGVLHLILTDPLFANTGCTSNKIKLQQSLSCPHPPAVVALTQHVVNKSLNGAPLSQNLTFAHTDVDDEHDYLLQESQESHFTLQSTSSHSSNTSKSVTSTNPTVLGRQKRKKGRLGKGATFASLLECVPEDDRHVCSKTKLLTVDTGNDELSFTTGRKRRRVSKREDNLENDARSMTSTGSQLLQTQQQLDTVLLRIMRAASVASQAKYGTAVHICSTDSNDVIQAIPLLALSRIITGKMEGGEESCFDVDLHSNKDDLNDDTDDDDNPLLITNSLIGEIGIVPLMSHALASTLAVANKQLSFDSSDLICKGCIEWIYKRVQILVSLIDGASLLNDSNRQSFCREGYCDLFGGPLIAGLIRILQLLLDRGKLLDGTWGEIALEILKTLTSLTHDNETAARELEQPESLVSTRTKKSCHHSRLAVVAHVLHSYVQQPTPRWVEKVKYDAVIFCLNILANVTESKRDTHTILTKLLIPATVPGKTITSASESNETLFLSWLVEWLVRETSSFRDAVAESTFGVSPSKHADRRLESFEEEKLMTAGNGFVLLACLLTMESPADSPVVMHQTILDHLPAKDTKGKYMFLTNTLRAFCNFYRYSVGDLSVAIVAPVKQLIAKLEMLVIPD